jgi:hypothetical protein
MTQCFEQLHKFIHTRSLIVLIEIRDIIKLLLWALQSPDLDLWLGALRHNR